jgi:hypothetical protein
MDESSPPNQLCHPTKHPIGVTQTADEKTAHNKKSDNKTITRRLESYKMKVVIFVSRFG